MSAPRMTIAELRRALRAALPADTFEPQPMRGVMAWLEIALLIGGSAFIAVAHLPWWANLAASLVLGQLIVSISLAAHEAMHGSVFRSPRANRLLGTVGFLPILVTPDLWMAWHVQAHHGATNQAERDPDALMELAAYRQSWRARMRARMSPGHRHWLSVASLLFMFTLQGQVFLWSHCDDPAIRDRIALRRTRERILSTLWIAAWLAGAIAVGRDALWVFAIPLATANFTLMAYISTQHWVRPLVDADDPRTTTVSVHAPRLFDWWHFQFSYHQEHHLFPRMSHRFGRRVRAKLREIDASAIAVLPWGAALRAVFTTPALYRDAVTLAHEDGSDAVALAALADQLGLPAVGGDEERAPSP
jgi:fatty acid desaturase